MTVDGRFACPCKRDAGIAEVATEPLWTYPEPRSSPTPTLVGRNRYDLLVSDRNPVPSDPRETRPVRVLIYSDDSDTRAQVALSLGKRPHPDLPPFEYFECATEPAVIVQMDGGGFDLAILDGEAVPAGGMGIARQLKEEIFRCPPLLVLTGRAQDAWLATWSRAEGVVPHPIDAIQLAEAVIALARERLQARAIARS